MTKLTQTQPVNLNQLNIVSFEVNFARLPNVQYFCQRVNIPAVILGDAFQPMPFMNLPVEGDTLSFEAMNISFILDEDMQNYTEIYSWLTALGFPRDYEQFKTLKPESEASQYFSMFSDVNIILNTNKSNPNYKILGPASAPVEKIQGNWRTHLIIKTIDRNISSLHQFLYSTIGFTIFERKWKGVRILVDVDPVSML